MGTRPDITIWCDEGHLVQKFRWLVGEGVWEPMHLQSEVTYLYPGGLATAPLILNPADAEENWQLGPAPERMKWPLRCRACGVSNPVRAERATLVLNLLTARGVTTLPLPEFLSELSRLFPPSTSPAP